MVCLLHDTVVHLLILTTLFKKKNFFFPTIGPRIPRFSSPLDCLGLLFYRVIRG